MRNKQTITMNYNSKVNIPIIQKLIYVIELSDLPDDEIERIYINEILPYEKRSITELKEDKK
jgi:hypothetical protein